MRTTLEIATRKVAATVAKKYQSEGIFAFAIYTSGAYSYVIDSFSTIDGLKSVAEKYLEEKVYQDKWGNLAIAMRELKWSPCDSPCHGTFESEFKRANDQLNSIWAAVDSDSEESYFDTCRQIHEVFIAVLLAIRQSGVFTESVVLNVLMGDQSDEERLLNAEILNSKEVLKAFRKELHCDSRKVATLRKNRWNA